MKRNKIEYDRWLRMLLLSLALLTGGGWMAWGQTDTRPMISLTWNDNDHDKVHTEEKIIYVNPDKPRVLSIPELNINNRSDGDDSYNWFVHWYVLNSNNETTGTIRHKSITVNGIDASNRGGSIGEGTSVTINGTNTKEYTTSDFFVRVKETQGLLWSNRLKTSSVIPLIENKRGLGIDASAIAYTLPSNYTEGDIIYCDVSVYQDGIWTPNSNPSNVVGTYQEPTLLKRYKYVIKKADECPTFNRDSETYEIDFPNKTNSINLSMPYAPDNYFWKTTDGIIHQGAQFVYQINNVGEFQPFHLVTKTAELKFQQNQKIKIEDLYTDKENIVKVKAICSVHPNESSDVLATFKFRPIENAEFKLEEDLDKGKDDDRWPRGNTEKYELIGIVDFDQKDKDKDLPTTIAPGDNMSSQPVGAKSEARTSYGFIRKDGTSLLDNKNKCYTSSPGMYGLFRSANAEYSKHDADASTKAGVNRKYKWIPPYIEGNGGHKHQDTYYQDVQLYDRTFEITKNTPNTKHGYFYYIDATDEPGTLVEVPVDGNICGNTELTVTGWVADMTRPCNSGFVKPLPPNLNIIFKASKVSNISNESEDVILHIFTTGDALTNYVYLANHRPVWNPSLDANADSVNTYLMKWQQFHYKFIISEEKIAGCTDFRLEVQNNEPHTDGADYAIDDIRIFKRKPEVGIVQAGDLCDTELKDVRFVTSYSNIMNVMGLKSNEVVDGINKDVVWDEEALPSALVEFIKEKYPDDPEGAVENYFTKIYYSIYGSENTDMPLQIDYDGDGELEYCRVSYLSTRREDMEWVNHSSFATEQKDNTDKIYSMPLEIGKYFQSKKYIARISTQPIGGPNGLPLKCDACALTGDPFEISVAEDRFKIYGLDDTKTEVSEEEVEQDKKYHITGNFQYFKDDKWNTLENALFDWFIGTLEEAEKLTVKVEGKNYSIKEALNEIATGGENNRELLENALRDQYGFYSKDNPSGLFVLGVSSFDYEMVGGYQSVIGLVRAKQKDPITSEEIDEELYCPDPVVIKLGGNPPTITPGDPEVPEIDPKDPDDPDDPQPDKDPETGSYVRSVRVGLIQIQEMVEKGGILRIPIHIRNSGKEDRIFSENKKNVDIKVVQTTDKKFENDPSLVIATLDKLVDKNTTANWKDNYFEIRFTDKAIGNFREGFWYMVDIPYAVVYKDNVGKIAYENSFKLTLKIVPEYVTWVGSENGMHNWNNDDLKHWRRSKNAELYMSGENVGAEANGTHPEAYTPMRFTKVTIHGKATVEEKDGSYSYGDQGVAYAAYPHLYKLEKNTGDQEKDPENVLLNMDPGTNLSDEIGFATKNIEYDLLADPDYEVELGSKPVNELGEHSYSCVRFYGNTCDEIYIKPESEILHTEYLTYNKAHVDYETDPNRWYMLASPLKGVVSGDMYLPTGNNGIGKYARQETPAFEDIKYNTTDYTRWEPAVYMRGWNNGSVNVIYPNGVAQYGVSANWSNLYNDVDVPFVSGSGFSIGTKTPLKPEKESVLFRLPKADVSYRYYKDDNETSDDEKDITSENRQGNGRFYFSPDTTSLNVTTTGMLGNPFMSHLDMKKFFDANHSTNNTYYIMSGNTTITNIAGDEYKLSTESDDPNYVAPLQSFIKNDLKNAVFTTDMIAKAPTSGKKVGLRSATAAASEKTLPQLRITASRGGVHNTALVAGLVTASDSYIEGEDAALLINEEVAAPQVYTLAGNQMTAINVTPELKDIPVGIYGKDASPVELSFKLSGDMQNVTFVDKQSGKVYPVTDGLTLTVSGNTSGRYFLNGSIATSNEVIARNEIVCYANGNGQIVVSSVDPLTRISVYSVSGQRLRYLDNLNMQTVYVKDLAPGIYIVKAESVTQVCSEKMEVK